jgi:hypothetical protein
VDLVEVVPVEPEQIVVVVMVDLVVLDCHHLSLEQQLIMLVVVEVDRHSDRIPEEQAALEEVEQVRLLLLPVVVVELNLPVVVVEVVAITVLAILKVAQVAPVS